MTTASSADARRDELVERLFGSALGAMDLLCVYLGDRLGMYRALADAGPSTSAELAGAAGVNERYAREWLEQQAMAGILAAVEPDASDAERRYAVPAGHDEVLLEGDSLNHMAPMAQLLVACALPIHAVLEAFGTGDGVPYADYGADLHEGQARFTQPLFDNLLASDWFPAVPAIHDRLAGDPPARVADIACGLGRSSIAIARGYPKVVVDGIDLDQASIARAKQLLPGSGVEDRVAFHCRDAGGSPTVRRAYDLVTIFEALHDMSYPVEVLQTARGCWTAVACSLPTRGPPSASRWTPETWSASTTGSASCTASRWGWSARAQRELALSCVRTPCAATRTRLASRIARVASIENDFWRFYLLRP